MAQETTDEELAAGWEASVASGKPVGDDAWDAEGAQGDGSQSLAQAAVGSERILNQDEIDSLLGFDVLEAEDSDRTGIMEMPPYRFPSWRATFHPSVPATTVPEFVRWLRERRQPAAFASSGNGSSVHVMAELFAAALGVEILHVPYKGNAPGLADLMGGQVQAMFDSPGSLGHARSGRLRALGITSAERSMLAPELMPIAKAGEPALAGFEAGSWFGFLLPAAVPKALQARLHADLQAVMAPQAMQEELVRIGIEPRPMSQSAFAAYLGQQLATWGPVIRAKNIKPD